MYLMYVDESGDAGMAGSPTELFVLSGIVVHDVNWRQSLEQLIEFRRRMRRTFGLKLREEIHASALISSPGELVRIKRHDRLTILRHFADQLATMKQLSVLNVVVDKRGKPANYDPFSMAWDRLIQRYENTIARRNFAGSTTSEERGLIFPDATDDKKLRVLVRKKRRYNPLPNQREFGEGYRDVPLKHVIEDPLPRDSRETYFVQAADLVAYFLYQSIMPNAYMRKKAGHRYFERLEPILFKKASCTDPMGIVRI